MQLIFPFSFTNSNCILHSSCILFCNRYSGHELIGLYGHLDQTRMNEWTIHLFSHHIPKVPCIMTLIEKNRNSVTNSYFMFFYQLLILSSTWLWIFYHCCQWYRNPYFIIFFYIFPRNLNWTRRTGLHKFRAKKKFPHRLPL